MEINKTILGIGIFLIFSGILLVIFSLVGKFLPLFKLPGDIIIEKENFGFYFPIVTSIILSIILTVILNIIFKIFKF
ncbi:MAG: DUF2905 domain-containing protein [Brevinematia bacterium]